MTDICKYKKYQLFQYERRNNASLNISMMKDEEIKGYVNDNPHVWLYQIIYIFTFVSMVLIGLIKGYSIARQLLIGIYKISYY